MAKRASFICESCGAAHDRWQHKCQACGGLTLAPRLSFASLLISVPSGDFERDSTPIRDIDL